MSTNIDHGQQTVDVNVRRAEGNKPDSAAAIPKAARCIHHVVHLLIWGALAGPGAMLCAALTMTRCNTVSQQCLGQVDGEPGHAEAKCSLPCLGHILSDFLTEPARKGRALFQAPDNGNLLVVDGNIYRGQTCTTSQQRMIACRCELVSLPCRRQNATGALHTQQVHAMQQYSIYSQVISFAQYKVRYRQMVKEDEQLQVAHQLHSREMGWHLHAAANLLNLHGCAELLRAALCCAHPC